MTQEPREDEIDSRLLLQFKHGSVYDEVTTYSQRGVFRLTAEEPDPQGKGDGAAAALTPKPRMLRTELHREGEDHVVFAGDAKQAARHFVNLELGGVTGLVASLVGKSPPDLRYWLAVGEIPRSSDSRAPCS